MEEHRLTRLLRLKSAEVPGQTRFCPDDELIVGYFEGTLSGQILTGLRRHLADCRYCQARVGNLERLGDGVPDQGVSGSVLADAKRLVMIKSPEVTRKMPAWATAAVLVLALIIVSKREPQSGTDVVATSPEVQQAPESPRQLRSMDRADPAPRIISPLEGDNVQPGDLKIRWTKVPGSLHYNVRVVTTEGMIVWNDRVQDTEWSSPVDHLLEPGTAYFVRVDAYLAEANSVSSDHILFTTQERKQ